jgi:hypothetical protein
MSKKTETVKLETTNVIMEPESLTQINQKVFRKRIESIQERDTGTSWIVTVKFPDGTVLNLESDSPIELTYG